MKRLWIAALFALIITLIIVTGVYCIDSASNKVDSHLKSAVEYVTKNDMKSAENECKIAENEWAKSEKALRLFINADEVASIGLTITTLQSFAKYDEPAELLAQISVARIQLIHMSNMEVSAG